jgi:hypothetical protein
MGDGLDVAAIVRDFGRSSVKLTAHKNSMITIPTALRFI